MLFPGRPKEANSLRNRAPILLDILTAWAMCFPLWSAHTCEQTAWFGGFCRTPLKIEALSRQNKKVYLRFICYVQICIASQEKKRLLTTMPHLYIHKALSTQQACICNMVRHRLKEHHTTGFWLFAVCPRHTAKAPKHTAYMFAVRGPRRIHDGDQPRRQSRFRRVSFIGHTAN